MKLRIRAFALSTGIVLGIVIFLVTLLFIIRDYRAEMLANLSGVLFGYRVTVAGSFIGLAWGLIYGFIGGAVFAWLYNQLLRMYKEKSGE